jgi:excisionase family DNA binding protein
MRKEEMKTVTKLLSTQEAAKKLNIGERRVRVLIESGRLPAQQVSGIWVILESDLKAVKHRPMGRPKKEKRK